MKVIMRSFELTEITAEEMFVIGRALLLMTLNNDVDEEVRRIATRLTNIISVRRNEHD